MAKKITLQGNAIEIEDTLTDVLDFSLRAKDCWYNEKDLENNSIVNIYYISGDLFKGNAKFSLANTVDVDDVAYTKESFRNFARDSMGFSLGGSASLKTGWAYYQDSAYTSIEPLVVNNSRVLITIDGLGSNTNNNYLPRASSDLWQSNAITPNSVGDSYFIRLDFTAEMNSNGGYGEVQLDIGSDSQIVIVNKTIDFVKGIGVPQNFSETIPIFCLETFKANGGRLYMDTRAGSDDMDVYDLGISIYSNN